MARRRNNPTLRTRNKSAAAPPAAPRWRRWAIGFLALSVSLALTLFLRGLSSGPRLRAQALAAQDTGDWKAALKAWNAYNQSNTRADAGSLLQEARAALTLHQAVPARLALERATQRQPADPRPWLLLLELLRLEDRPLEALQLGDQALAAVPPQRSAEILRALTLTLLSEVPEAEARQSLAARIKADPADLDAQAAYLRRIAANPSTDDPSRPDRITSLQGLLTTSPQHVGLREALVNELADAGEPALGREALDAWPADARDARFQRLGGRWALEYDDDPRRAVELLRKALTQLPHDGPTRYRLARALKLDGRLDEAREEADRLARTREALDPRRLSSRLEADLSTRDDPEAQADLARLCRQVGLNRLSQAWQATSTSVSSRP